MARGTRQPDGAALAERVFLWQERTAERWGKPLSSRLDRLSRHHVILGPLLVSVILFVGSALVLWALFGLYLVIDGVSAVAAYLLLIFNIGYYRWLVAAGS